MVKKVASFRKDKYFLLSPGCAKNTVGSESMAQGSPTAILPPCVTHTGLPPTKEGA